MAYCPYCSEQIKSDLNVCPHCHKSLDLDMYGSVFSPGESTDLNRAASRRLWFKEHARFIFPIIFLIIGLTAGVLATFTYAQIHFAQTRSNFEQQIGDLNSQLAVFGQNRKVERDSLQAVIAERDTVVTILAEQNRRLYQIISFTRRMAGNSTITANSAGEQDYFRRNFRYLDRMYRQQQDKLAATYFGPLNTSNLQTIPALLGE